MENIQFDSGMQCFRVNEKGVLRFNPADPNIYARFLQLHDKLGEMEQELGREETVATQLQLADRKIKELLSWVFGSHNDFEQILDGVSLLAVATNGQRVLQNLLDALEPILHKGLHECAAQLIRQAREERGQGC